MPFCVLSLSLLLFFVFLSTGLCWDNEATVSGDRYVAEMSDDDAQIAHCTMRQFDG